MIRVTVEDLDTGEKDSIEIEDDYVLITEGSCTLHRTSTYCAMDGSSTHILTVRGRKSREEAKAA